MFHSVNLRFNKSTATKMCKMHYQDRQKLSVKHHVFKLPGLCSEKVLVVNLNAVLGLGWQLNIITSASSRQNVTSSTLDTKDTIKQPKPNKHQELKVKLEYIFEKRNPLVSTHSFTQRTLPLPIQLVSQMLSQAIEGSHVLILKCRNPSTGLPEKGISKCS